MLPYPLLYLTQAILFPLISAQQQITLNSASSFSSSSRVSIPASTDVLTVSVALCTSGTSTPRFFVTNNTQISVPSAGDVGQSDVFEIEVADGIGIWTGFMENGGTLVATDSGRSSYEIGVSTTGDPVHEYLGDWQYPLLADSTSNQALLFSPVFENITQENPAFPNYTLPSAQSPFSVSSPSSNTQFNLTLLPSSSSFGSLWKSGCAMKNVTSTGTVINQTSWLKDDSGWRSQWFIEGLTPQTNYSAYVVQDGTKVSGPMFFATKSSMPYNEFTVTPLLTSLSGSFDCPLVHSLPYCPSVSWAVPLPQPQGSDLYDATNLASNISIPIQQYMTNFTTMLSTFACGRDIYSPLQSCAVCQDEYRKWLCAISFPRCGEATSSPISAALVPQNSSSTPRNPNFPQSQGSYNELLPCLETCHAVDRACPNFVGFQCPLKQYTASASYGLGYIDSTKNIAGEGSTGAAQDRYGNVWCNGG